MTLLRKSMPLLLGMLLIPGLACAQGVLRDPTTPPPGAPRQVQPGSVPAGDAAGVVTAAPQSVIRITPVGGARKQEAGAGPSLKPEGQMGSWRVVTITSHSMVLKDSRGTRTVATPSSSVKKKNLSGATSEQ